MELAEYRRRRLAWQKKAHKRDLERVNIGMGFDEDIPHYAKTTDEAVIELIEKVESFEKLFGAPDPDKVEKPKIGSRLKLAEEKPSKTTPVTKPVLQTAVPSTKRSPTLV